VRYYDVPLWPALSPLTAGVPAPVTPPAAPPEPVPADRPPLVQGSTYSILVGSFPTQAEAAAASERLKADGYVVGELVQTEGREEYRVLVGPYTDVALAREHAARLQQDPVLQVATVVTAQ